MFSGLIKNIVDFVMMKLGPIEKRSSYAKFKIKNSDDFSDLKEGLEPVKNMRDEQIKEE